MKDFKKLVQSNFLPHNLRLIEATDSRLVTFEEFKKLSAEGKTEGKVPILDNPLWIAVSAKNVWYSMGQDGLMSKMKQGKMDMRVMEFDGKGFVPHEIINFRIREEDMLKGFEEGKANLANGGMERIQEMARQKALASKAKREMEEANKNNTKENVEEVKMELGKGVDIAGLKSKLETTKMNMDEVTTQSTVVPSVTDKIVSQDMSEEGEVPAWLMDIADFNRNNKGGLVCLVTDKDSRVQASANKVQVPKSKKGAGADYDGQGATDAAVSTEGANNSKYIGWSQSAPGKIVGGVIRIPRGGFFTVSELETGKKLSTNEPLVVDYADKDQEYMLLDLEALKATIGYSFLSEIPELAETYGKPGEFTRIEIVPRTRTVRKTGEKKTSNEIVLKTSRAGKVLSLNAYFPIKTFETINVSKKGLTQADIDVVNMSTFFPFYKKAKNAIDEPANLLIAEEVTKIGKEQRGDEVVYVSEFFKLEGATLPVKVKPWYATDKEATLAELEIPVKTLVTNEKSGNTRAVVKTINCIKDAGKPGYQELSSLTSGKFGDVIAASGGQLNAEQLHAIFGREGSSAKAKENLASGKKHFGMFNKMMSQDKTKIDSMLKRYK